MTTKYTRLREAALEAEAEERKGRVLQPAWDVYMDLCDPQTVLALLDAIDVVRQAPCDCNDYGPCWPCSVMRRVAALDKEPSNEA